MPDFVSCVLNYIWKTREEIPKLTYLKNKKSGNNICLNFSRLLPCGKAISTRLFKQGILISVRDNKSKHNK